MSGTAVWFGAVDPAYRIRRPLTPRVWTCVGALACAIGLSGSNGFHILATHSIPSAQANWTGDSGNVLARGCALSTLLCAALHGLLESTVLPSMGALAASAATASCWR